ncbi:acyl-CoA thioesterase [Treponema parvum]|uniref:acyl-CoA thioesterase n=1 Tax=Treponema parvum TaxID=138851 RepID=UPI001AEBDCC4|nr:thioesterase family protein [Treponema parvum]QTQ15689.1 acyl-CoA thioesterase [Treponema parvum]
MKHFAELTVRSYECDSYGHVNNAVYLNYLEYARMEYLHKIGFDYNAAVAEGFYLYVTHIDIYYKASAFLDDKLTIEVYSVNLGAVSGTMHQVIRKEDGTVCVEADVTWASVNKENGRPCRLPEKFMVPGLLPDKSGT